MNSWDLNLALEAWRSQRAVLKSGRQLFILKPDALVFCPLSMAGEDPSLHAVMVGALNGGSQVLASPDPRSPRSRLELFSRLLKVLEPYFQSARDETDGLPQIVVPSASALNLISSMADWLPYLPDPDSGGQKMLEWTEDARRLGSYFQLFAQRSLLTGQQLILNASQLLDDHYAFGQDLKGHLGAQIVWLDPPADGDVFRLALEETRQPMGVRSDARFDEEVLNPAIEGWLKVEKGGSRSLASFRRKEVEDALLSVLQPIDSAVRQAMQELLSLRLEPLHGIAELWARDRRAVEWHLQRMEDGGRFARRDDAARAAYGLAESEDALEQWEASRLWFDPLYRAKGRSEGNVLSGACVKEDVNGETYCRVVSDQEWLRIRVGDQLNLIPGGASGVVEGISRGETGSEVLLRITGSADDLPDAGEGADWGGQAPDWHRLSGHRGNLSKALSEPPPTHLPDQDESPEAPVWSEEQGDPLIALEELR